MKAEGKRAPIRVGIAGLGRSGWDIHCLTLKTLPEQYRVVAVNDSNAARRKQAQELHNCRAYATYEELVADPEVELLVVARRTHLHAENSIAALEAGKMVICEKAMARTAAEADTMIAAARRTGMLLTVFHNRRFSSEFMKVKEIVGSGLLGRIVAVRANLQNFGRRWDWQTLKSQGGGNLRNGGSHFIDLILALDLIDLPEPEVHCVADHVLTLGDADDFMRVTIQAPGAPVLEVEVSSACAYPENNWHVQGSRGGLAGSLTRMRWKYCHPEEWPPRQVIVDAIPDRSHPADEIRWDEESWSVESYDPGYAGYYRSLYGTIREGAPLAVTPESVRRVIWVIERAAEIAGI